MQRLKTPRKALLRVRCARIGRCEQIPNLQGYVEEELMDLLGAWARAYAREADVDWLELQKVLLKC